MSSRILAAFLSWMQERKAAVFVAATCNNVTVLPPELIRKGRFDELFFVDLPDAAERAQIFAIQLAKRKHDPAEFDLKGLAAAAGGYSGAEINAAVQAALYTAFAESKSGPGGSVAAALAASPREPQLRTEHILNALAGTVPLSRTRAEEIEALRCWAQTRAVAAS